MQINKSNQSQVLSPRKLNRRNSKESIKPPRNYFRELLELLLPPFLLAVLSFLFRILASVVSFIINIFKTEEQLGEASQEFHKRRYQEAIEDLDVEQDQLGFTNQVLVQDGRKTVNFFLPVYVTCKIKSIQDVSVQSLTGNISCALIVNVKYGDIPQEIVTKLESSIIMQLNCGQALLLKDDGLSITVKRNQKQNFLIFTIRRVFLSFLIQDTLWSPFELLELVISLTLNTVSIAPNSLQKLKQPTGYQPKKEYKVSFNCMRNSDLIPISFALDCVYGVYDLAERKLETYHSKFGTLKQIQKNHEEITNKKKQGSKNKKQQKKQKKIKKKQQIKKPQKAAQQEVFPLISLNPPPPSQPNAEGKTMKFLTDIAEGAVRRLSMRVGANDFKPPPKKVKYFQYTHLVIPLYKYPGNSLVTIFLPVLLLALLSLAIFFQQPQLSGRIGSIATMFLGYIALIPSIKQQLPPSSKLTVIQTLVYIQTICCMLCLYQSFMISDIDNYKFEWESNYTFLICLLIHSGVFLFVLVLYTIHKLRWQPNYNYNQKIAEVKPVDNHISWDNPYCDHVFIKYNKEIMNNQSLRNKDERFIKPYVNPVNAASATVINQPPKDVFDKQEDTISISMFEDAPKRTQQRKTICDLKEQDCLLKVPTSPKSMGQFVFPDQKLYYSGKKKQQ